MSRSGAEPGRVDPEFYVDLELKRTSGRGSGLVVARPVTRGQKVLAFGGPVLSREAYLVHADVDHCLQIGPDTFLGPSGELDDFTNHACEPSTRVEIELTSGRAFLVAHRDLPMGTEVTFDYSSVQLDDPLLALERCLCGASGCRGRIVDFASLGWRQKERLVEQGLCVWYVEAAYTKQDERRALTNPESPQT